MRRKYYYADFKCKRCGHVQTVRGSIILGTNQAIFGSEADFCNKCGRMAMTFNTTNGK